MGWQGDGHQPDGQAGGLSAVATVVGHIVSLSFTDGTEVMLLFLRSLSDIKTLETAGKINSAKG